MQKYCVQTQHNFVIKEQKIQIKSKRVAELPKLNASIFEKIKDYQVDFFSTYIDDQNNGGVQYDQRLLKTVPYHYEDITSDQMVAHIEEVERAAFGENNHQRQDIMKQCYVEARLRPESGIRSLAFEREMNKTRIKSVIDVVKPETYLHRSQLIQNSAIKKEIIDSLGWKFNAINRALNPEEREDQILHLTKCDLSTQYKRNREYNYYNKRNLNKEQEYRMIQRHAQERSRIGRELAMREKLKLYKFQELDKQKQEAKILKQKANTLTGNHVMKAVKVVSYGFDERFEEQED